jgi:hypothetical protein
MLKKAKEGETWSTLLKLDKGKEKMKMPEFDEKSDPQESMMKMMKQMYEEVRQLILWEYFNIFLGRRRDEAFDPQSLARGTIEEIPG